MAGESVSGQGAETWQKGKRIAEYEVVKKAAEDFMGAMDCASSIECTEGWDVWPEKNTIRRLKGALF